MKLQFRKPGYSGNLSVDGKQLVFGEVYDLTEEQRVAIESVYSDSLHPVAEEPQPKGAKPVRGKKSTPVEMLLDEIKAGEHDNAVELSELFDKYSDNKLVTEAITARLEHVS